MNILVVHLASGQTVVGKRVPALGAETTLNLEDPFELIVGPNGSGQMQVGYIGYGACMGYLPRLQSVAFLPEHFIAFIEAPKKVEDGYFKASSGLLIGGA